MDALDRSDLLSQTWRKVEAILRSRRAEHLEQIAIPGLPHDQTETLRGRVAEVDSLLLLSRNASSSVVAPPSFITGDEEVSVFSDGFRP